MILVSCVLLNQTSWKQVRPILPAFEARYPTPSALSLADPEELAEMIRGCGLQHRRSRTLIRLASEIAKEGWQDRVADLPGVGQYALDAWKIFVLEDLSVAPQDKELKRYVIRRLSRSCPS